ncbi:MAG: peptidoglycan-associated lipoprotein [Rhodobacterales bacterium 17-64-5]|nr:MAG: peptidoglycan-associated lipoprotein [Rhodobacterales bacterium 17-64-5]
MSVRLAIPFKVLLIVSALALSACRNPDRFGGAGGNGTGGAGANGAGGLGTNGVTTSGLGDPSNPASVAYFNQSVGDRVLFVVDQSTLTDVARTTLNGQAQWLKANPDYAIIVEGHADEQGTREYNIALGARRADAVRNYLISQGVPGSRMQTVSYGKERPIALCSEESCYAQNRRAVTVLSMGSGT